MIIEECNKKDFMETRLTVDEIFLKLRRYINNKKLEIKNNSIF